MPQKGAFSIALQYTHSNIFAMYNGTLLQALDAMDRAQYVSTNYAATNYYYFDTASGVMNLYIGFGITDKISAAINIPFISYQNGFMDMPIETFHNTFGIANQNRAGTAKNQSELFIKSDDEICSANNNSALGDVVVDLKTNLYRNYKGNFEITLLSAIKLPTGNYIKLSGSGSFDYGFDLLVTNSWKRHTVANNISAVFPGKWKLFSTINPRNIYAWVIGYEYYINDIVSLIAQNRILSSPLNQNDFPSAAKPAFEWTTGLKIDVLNNLRLSLAVTQNYINHENVPDFGFFINIQTFL